MTNKEFDRWLRESLSSVSPDSFPGDWDDFVKRVEDAESGTDAEFDSAVREGLASLGAGLVPDWNRMESLLDADETAFDGEIRDSIRTYQAPYDPDSWPILDGKLDDDEKNRRRLILAKALEITAIFVVILTLLNFFPAIQSLLKEKTEPVSSAGQETAYINQKDAAIPTTSDEDLSSSTLQGSLVLSDQRGAPGHSELAQVSVVRVTSSEAGIVESSGKNEPLQTNDIPVDGVAKLNQPPITSIASIENQSLFPSGLSPRVEVASTPIGGIELTSLNSPERALMASVIPVANYPNPSGVRFSMYVGADVNTLFIPEDHFYSQGRSIRFSEKSIEAGGYTAGASLLFDKQKFLIEVGLSYSQKSFSPGRKLYLGTSPDEHSLDFDNITLNIVSLPINLHVKFDGKGAWRVYGVGGAAVHVVASANYDLITETSFASAAPQDPFQLQTEREIQRVKESMLDGAKFSSKGYLTANVGLGVEHFVNGRTSVFAQPMYQYQIPFFNLIDQNGKHLKTLSLMLGTRISL